MGTKIYGTSDDLIEFEGECHGEIECYGTNRQQGGILLLISDGTILEVKYGKLDQAIWEVKLFKAGPLFDRIELCIEENATPYSDIAYFREGVVWAYAATEWQKVR